jgi:hypothetical protein
LSAEEDVKRFDLELLFKNPKFKNVEYVKLAKNIYEGMNRFRDVYTAVGLSAQIGEFDKAKVFISYLRDRCAAVAIDVERLDAVMNIAITDKEEQDRLDRREKETLEWIKEAG